MSGALAGIVVVDATTQLWASLGVALLADFGAQVVRVETLPEARERRSPRDGDPPAAWDYRYELANRNKLSLAVDPETAAGREVLRDLIRKADVFVTDRSGKFLREKGLDYPSAVTLRGDIVYARACGFGPEGPDQDLPALDELAAARTGMMPILPQPGQPPVYAGAGQMYTAVFLAFGVAAALNHRQQTGEGQEVDVSLFGGNIYGASLDVQAYLAIQGERFLSPISRLDAGNPMSGTMYPTKDGRWVTLTMPDTDRYWPAFAEAVGLDPQDPRFDSHENRCEVNRMELIRLLEGAFPQQPADHWRSVFVERNLSGDVIEDYSYPANDPQALRSGYILQLEHPSLGAVKTIGFPVFMSETPPRLRRTAPCLGQHTAEVLHDLLGYAEERIEELAAEGVIG